MSHTKYRLLLLFVELTVMSLNIWGPHPSNAIALIMAFMAGGDFVDLMRGAPKSSPEMEKDEEALEEFLQDVIQFRDSVRLPVGDQEKSEIRIAFINGIHYERSRK